MALRKREDLIHRRQQARPGCRCRRPPRLAPSPTPCGAETRARAGSTRSHF